MFHYLFNMYIKCINVATDALEPIPQSDYQDGRYIAEFRIIYRCEAGPKRVKVS